MILVTLNKNQDNYDVISVGTTKQHYTLIEGQKFAEVEEWPTTGEWRKKDLIWNDKNKKLSKK